MVFSADESRLDDGELIDAKKNLWVWCVGGRIRYPQAVLGNATFIYEMIEANPKMIFFFGGSGLANVNWNSQD